MRRFAWAVLGLVMLSGCAKDTPADDPADGNDTPAPATEDVPAAFEFPFAITGCAGVEILSQAQGSSLAQYVPEHFTVPDVAMSIVGTMHCGMRAEVVQRGFWAIQVEPTHPSLVSPRATNHFWMVEHYVHDRSDFAAAMADVRAITLNATVVANDPLVGPYLLIRSDNATFTWVSTGRVVPGAWEQVSGILDAIGPFREYFPAEGGYAYVDATFDGDGSAGTGVGTMTIEGESQAVQHYGRSSPQFGVYADYMDYAGAMVGFVPLPA